MKHFLNDGTTKTVYDQLLYTQSLLLKTKAQ